MCGDPYGPELVSLEGAQYKVTANVMRDFAYACFADRNQLDAVPFPNSLDATGAAATSVSSFINNKDGTYTAEVD